MKPELRERLKHNQRRNRMRLRNINIKTNNIAILLMLLMAFTVRTVLARLFFGSRIQIYVYYALTYLTLFVSLYNAFTISDRHVYAPKGLYAVLPLLLVITLSLLYCGNYSDLIVYTMAMLFPFAFRNSTKDSRFWPKLIASFCVFFSVGCVLNMAFPDRFRSMTFSLFSQTDQNNLILLWERVGYTSYHTGFTSQTGFAAFFLVIGLGCVFCFRKSVFSKSAGWLFLLLAVGLLLTGKRGPALFFVVALVAVYLTEGTFQKNLFRIVKILLILLAGYVFLFLMAKITHIQGIERIYETINQIILTGDLEDVGRKQLWDQAIVYFRQSPIFGIGWNNYKNLFIRRSTHVHCIYLQLLAETGVVGFTVFVSFFAFSLVRTVKRALKARRAERTLENCWYQYSLFIQVFFLLYGITGNPLYDSCEVILYMFAIGISFLPVDPLKSPSPAKEGAE